MFGPTTAYFFVMFRLLERTGIGTCRVALGNNGWFSNSVSASDHRSLTALLERWHSKRSTSGSHQRLTHFLAAAYSPSSATISITRSTSAATLPANFWSTV